MTKDKKNHILIEKQQRQLFKKIIGVLPMYKRYVNKAFLFITEDGSDYIGYFTSKDFIHLTGIRVDVIESNFFDDICAGKNVYRSISKTQHYNNHTINKKIEILSNLDSFILNENNLKNLIIEDYRTLTTDSLQWSFALRNDDLRYTLCFSSIDNAARSTRKELSAPGSIKKKVICVFSRLIQNDEFTNLEYLDLNYSINNILEKLYPRYSLVNSNKLKYNKPLH